MHNGIVFCHKEEWNYIFFRKMGETGNHHVQAKLARLRKTNSTCSLSCAESSPKKKKKEQISIK
jgi:hypothetical protein